MRKLMLMSLTGALAVSTAAQTDTPAPAAPPAPTAEQIRAYEDYARVVASTVSMVSDAEARRLAAEHGLHVLNVTWEDTGRFKGSAVGPNISDVTIQVQQQDPRTGQHSLSLMPVIRFPNFSDRTADIPLERFYLLVGNEKDGQDLQRVTLKEFLEDPRMYLSNPGSWAGENRSLLARRDTHALVSAQACFLPVPREGMATFNPVIFNYQSSRGNPAVLTILATRQGTSVTIIDNTRDGFSAGHTWGQRLFFNKAGERASLTGQRLSDFTAAQEPGDGPAAQPQAQAAGESGLNMVLLIQVPLKYREHPRRQMALFAAGAMEAPAADMPMEQESDVEAAVIGHGEVEGPFTEIDGLAIERDDRFPVRVTVQFYKATSNGVINSEDAADIAAQINRVYEQADYVGSLVISGETGRPTEHDGEKFEPPDWWERFWERHEQNTGMTPEQTLEMLRRLRGQQWLPQTEQEAADAVRELR